jgi:hypothetical protein
MKRHLDEHGLSMYPLYSVSARQGRLIDANWIEQTQESVSIVVKGKTIACNGFCSKDLQIGDVAVKVVNDGHESGSQYYCIRCYEKVKLARRIEKYEGRKTKKAEDKYEL